jgi:hypothetical protein
MASMAGMGHFQSKMFDQVRGSILEEDAQNRHSASPQSVQPKSARC